MFPAAEPPASPLPSPEDAPHPFSRSLWAPLLSASLCYQACLTREKNKARCPHLLLPCPLNAPPKADQGASPTPKGPASPPLEHPQRGAGRGRTLSGFSTRGDGTGRRGCGAGGRRGHSQQRADFCVTRRGDHPTSGPLSPLRVVERANWEQRDQRGRRFGDRKA